MNNKITLYAKDNRDQIRVWSIWSEGDVVIMSSGLLDGELTESTEVVEEGLQSRTLEQQIESRINSRVNKKIDSGYVARLEVAQNNDRTNSLGFKRPAKCTPYKDVKNKIPYDVTYIQKKLDGHHCNIICKHGVNIAYSSNGKIINTIPHILDDIKIPEGRTLEGELYHHGTPLQTISSWVKKKQPDSEKLHYYFYDIDMECDYLKRLDFLRNINSGDKFSFLQTDVVYGEFDIIPLMKSAVGDGYEGLIFRLNDYPHEDGKRSKGVIKVKTNHFDEFIIDDEFLIVDITPSKDMWAILHCVTDKGRKFKVSSPGDMNEKTEVLENKASYIGRHVRVSFSAWTKGKLPFHPVAEYFREKSEE